MATYVSLTAEQKGIVEAHERNFRGWFNELARLIVSARALDASYNAGGGSGSILATLDPGEDVPNTGGIAGAQVLDFDTDFTTLVNGQSSFLTTYDTVGIRQAIAKAAGPTAGL